MKDFSFFRQEMPVKKLFASGRMTKSPISSHKVADFVVQSRRFCQAGEHLRSPFLRMRSVSAAVLMTRRDQT